MAEQTKKAPDKKEKTRDTNLLASLAHFSILTVLILGPFSIAVPLILWLTERNRTDKSSLVEYHAKQAFFFQVAAYVVSAVLGICMVILSIILIGLLLIPVLVIFGLAVIVYGVYGGIQVNQGKEFRYMFVADFIEAGEKTS